MASRRLTRIMFVAGAGLLAVAAIEAGAALTTSYLVGRGWMAAVPHFASTEIENYFTHRDPVLGWKSAFVEIESPCASAYGDSFTGGSDGASYPAELSNLLDCPVANYGVGGYGSDQALMLARSLRHVDRAPVRILGHVSENILRNLNQYRNLLYPGQELFFKPRFVRDGDGLRRIEVPIARREDFGRLTNFPDTVLSADVFAARPRRRFPYSFAILRWLAGDFHVAARIRGVPRHEPFYHEDHDAEGLQLTARILSTFSRDASRDGRKAIVVLIPTGDDFRYAKRTSRWADAPLALALRPAGVTVVHAGPAMLALFGSGDPCGLFIECNSHFNARGHRLLAQVIAPAITAVAPRRARALDSRRRLPTPARRRRDRWRAESGPARALRAHRSG